MYSCKSKQLFFWLMVFISITTGFSVFCAEQESCEHVIEMPKTPLLLWLPVKDAIRFLELQMISKSLHDFPEVPFGMEGRNLLLSKYNELIKKWPDDIPIWPFLSTPKAKKNFLNYLFAIDKGDECPVVDDRTNVSGKRYLCTEFSGQFYFNYSSSDPNLPLEASKYIRQFVDMHVPPKFKLPVKRVSTSGHSVIALPLIENPKGLQDYVFVEPINDKEIPLAEVFPLRPDFNNSVNRVITISDHYVTEKGIFLKEQTTKFFFRGINRSISITEKEALLMKDAQHGQVTIDASLLESLSEARLNTLLSVLREDHVIAEPKVKELREKYLIEMRKRQRNNLKNSSEVLNDWDVRHLNVKSGRPIAVEHLFEIINPTNLRRDSNQERKQAVEILERDYLNEETWVSTKEKMPESIQSFFNRVFQLKQEVQNNPEFNTEKRRNALKLLLEPYSDTIVVGSDGSERRKNISDVIRFFDPTVFSDEDLFFVVNILNKYQLLPEKDLGHMKKLIPKRKVSKSNE